MKIAKTKSMEEIIVNESIMQFWEKQNSVGLCELLIGDNAWRNYFDSIRQSNHAYIAVLNICNTEGWFKYKKGAYEITAKEFVKIISYDDFKERRGISPAIALGIRLYLLHQCGVDWRNPNKELKVFEQ